MGPTDLSRPADARRTPPGPDGLPLVGILPQIWRDPLGFFARVAADHGGLARFGTRRFTLYLLSDPHAIREVLVERAERYWKGEGLAAARTVMGNGLATSHGPHWRRQRRLMQPAFAPAALDRLGPVLDRATDDLLARWGSGGTRDVLPDASAFALALIFGGLFGSDVDGLDTVALGRALAIANDWIHRAAWSPVKLPAAVPTPRRVRFRRAMALLDETVLGLIAERRQRSEPGDDLLGRLLAARDPDSGERMSDVDVRDEVMTAFVAGHDTTAAALAWGVGVLAQAPELAGRLAEEASTGPPRFDRQALTRMDLTGRTVQEVLRLYPPGWILVRTPRADLELAGYALPAGAPLLISPWVVHRNPQHWPEPARIDPDRFLPDAVRARPACAYLPFGAGARTCIGQHLAELTLRYTLSRIVSRFELAEVPGRPLIPRPGTTLQPRGGVWVRLSAR